MTFKSTVTDFDNEEKSNILGIDVLTKKNMVELDQSKYISKLREKLGIVGKNYLTHVESGFYFKHTNRKIDFDTK